eukprot:SAG11_NODE_3489_length_2416_cov_2.003884_2_plen_143_part_00
MAAHRLFSVVKQDSYEHSKIMRSLMDLEWDETYVTDSANTLQRTTLQTVTLSRTVEIPILGGDKGWVWMARGSIRPTTASTIHMLYCNMNLGAHHGFHNSSCHNHRLVILRSALCCLGPQSIRSPSRVSSSSTAAQTLTPPA